MDIFIPRVVVSGVKLNSTAENLKTGIDTCLTTNHGTIHISSVDGIMKTALGVEFLNLDVSAINRGGISGYGDMTQEQIIQFVHDFLKFVYCD